MSEVSMSAPVSADYDPSNVGESIKAEAAPTLDSAYVDNDPSASKRVRKAAQQFVNTAVVETSQQAPMTVAAGAGVPLADIPNVLRRLDNTKSTSTEIRRLYSLCFPQSKHPRAFNYKSILKRFSGLTIADARTTVDRKIKRMQREESALIPGVCALMDIDTAGLDSATVRAAMIEWLIAPKSSGRPYTKFKAPSSGSGGGSGKSKDKSSKSRDGDGDGSRKRSRPTVDTTANADGSDSGEDGGGSGASAFAVFSSAHRDLVRRQFPIMTVRELAEEMNRQWNHMSAEQKKPYITAAERIKEHDRRKSHHVEHNDSHISPQRLSAAMAIATAAAKAEAAHHTTAATDNAKVFATIVDPQRYARICDRPRDVGKVLDYLDGSDDEHVAPFGIMHVSGLV